MSSLYYKKLEKDLPSLAFAKPGDAGLDLAVKHETFLMPDEKRMIGTGIAVRIPDGHFGMIVPRSSCGKLGIMLANTVGIIDSQYTGELILYLRNISGMHIKLAPQQRIAQLIIVPYVHPAIIEVEELEETERGSGGFGHTG